MRRRALWRRWVLIVAAGELAGFAVPALVAAWAYDLAPTGQLLLLPAAGLVEGTALGAAQAVVLRRELASFPTRPWVVATALAASVAWFLGMLPSTTSGVWADWPRAWVVLAGCVLAVALLGSIGGAQAFVVRRVVVNPGPWVLWTGLGWCAGLAAFFLVASPLWHEGQALASTISVGVAAGVVMAVVMAAVTGRGVLGLVSGAAVTT